MRPVAGGIQSERFAIYGNRGRFGTVYNVTQDSSGTITVTRMGSRSITIRSRRLRRWRGKSRRGHRSLRSEVQRSRAPSATQGVPTPVWLSDLSLPAWSRQYTITSQPDRWNRHRQFRWLDHVYRYGEQHDRQLLDRSDRGQRNDLRRRPADVQRERHGSPGRPSRRRR